jgi:hypothetical protein
LNSLISPLVKYIHSKYTIAKFPLINPLGLGIDKFDHLYTPMWV